MNRIDTRKRTLLLATAALTLGAGAYAAGKAKPRVIKVVAKKFEFVPAEIRVKQGETVSLQFTAPEVPMGVNLADFNQRVDVVPGKTALLEFTPDKVGTFTFLCDVFCGSGHEDMSGTLVVT
jgi:cytochrome c oxidase subunit 2